MKSQLNRKTFLYATAATTLASVLGCSGEDEGTGDGDMGDGDDASSGGSGTWEEGSGGEGTGDGDGLGSGGDGSGGTDDGSGGDDAGSGGDDGSGGGDTGSGGDGGGDVCTADITIVGSGASEGHKHDLVITAAELMMTTDLTKNTTTESSHEHEVTITAAQLAMIRAGETVTIDACSQFLSHRFVISCAVPAPVPGSPDTCP